MIRRALVLAALLPGLAVADDNDLVLGRLTNPVDDGSGNMRFIPQNAELRSLASELGVVLAPHLMTPADTLGFGGFQLSLDYTTTTINADESHWRARNGAASSLTTVGFFARKGMWFPIPSFEIGAGATHLLDSHIWTGQLYAKLALVEGYHQLPLPSFAARGAVSRMMSQRELDLTVASFDLTASKHFGIGGTWRFDPFVGWNLLMIIPRSEVIDPTPNVDSLDPANTADSMNSFVFADQDTIFRHRFHVGAKFQFYVVELTVEAIFALAGSSTDDRSGTSTACMATGEVTTACDAKDAAGSQRTISISAGVDF